MPIIGTVIAPYDPSTVILLILKKENMNRVLVIGRRQPQNDQKIGGVVLLYQLFLDHLKQRSIPFTDIDLNIINYKTKYLAFIGILCKIAVHTLSSRYKSVSVHGTTTDFKYFVPVTVALCRLTNKPIVLRKFGGNFDLYYDSMSWPTKKLVTWSLNSSDGVFFETKFLVTRFSWLSCPVHWLPNGRDFCKDVVSRSEFNRRFIFVGQVKESKGINYILEASGILPSNYTVHIYGPCSNYTPPVNLSEQFERCYKGTLEPHKVRETMIQYDVLLLPTHHAGEGYPGVIIEAFSVGMPVITTLWRSIPEMFGEATPGVLIEPKSTSHLIEAIKSISTDNYSVLSALAREHMENYHHSEIVDSALEKFYIL